MVEKNSSTIKKITVIHFASWYPTANNPLLGIFIQKHLQLLQNEIKQAVVFFNISNNHKKNIEVIFTSSPINQIEIRVKKIFLLKYFFIVIGFIKSILVFHKKIGKPTLIHLHVILPLAPLVLIYKKISGLSLVFTEHWTGYQDEDGSYKGFFKKFFTQQLVKNAQAGITVSKHLAQTMHQKKLHFKSLVISNAVDITIFKPLYNDKKTHQFIHISSFDERQKNVTKIIKAFKRVVEYNPDIELLLVGPLENANHLQSIINQLSLQKNVHLIGKLYNQALAEKLSESAALILFSNYENQPVVVLESLCCGTPIITTPVGSLPEIITNENGILISVNNEIELSKAIIDVYENYKNFNPQKIRESILTILNPETIKQQHLHLYNQVINQHD